METWQRLSITRAEKCLFVGLCCLICSAFSSFPVRFVWKRNKTRHLISSNFTPKGILACCTRLISHSRWWQRCLPQVTLFGGRSITYWQLLFGTISTQRNKGLRHDSTLFRQLCQRQCSILNVQVMNVTGLHVIRICAIIGKSFLSLAQERAWFCPAQRSIIDHLMKQSAQRHG